MSSQTTYTTHDATLRLAELAENTVQVAHRRKVDRDGALAPPQRHLDPSVQSIAQALGRDIRDAVTPRPDPLQAVARAKRQKLPDHVALKRG